MNKNAAKSQAASAPQINPAVAAVCVVVVLCILAVVGWRMFRPTTVGGSSAPTAKPASTETINGVPVPPNVPSYYWKEHQGGQGQPQPATQGP